MISAWMGLPGLIVSLYNPYKYTSKYIYIPYYDIVVSILFSMSFLFCFSLSLYNPNIHPAILYSNSHLHHLIMC